MTGCCVLLLSILYLQHWASLIHANYNVSVPLIWPTGQCLVNKLVWYDEVLTMNKDSFINQDLPHSHCLTSWLQAIILLHQPVNKFLPGATLPEWEIQHGNFNTVCRDSVIFNTGINKHARFSAPVCFEMILSVSDQTGVLLNHDTVHRPCSLFDTIWKKLKEEKKTVKLLATSF